MMVYIIKHYQYYKVDQCQQFSIDNQAISIDNQAIA